MTRVVTISRSAVSDTSSLISFTLSSCCSGPGSILRAVPVLHRRGYFRIDGLDAALSWGALGRLRPGARSPTVEGDGMNRMVLSLVVVVAALGAAPAGAQEAGHVKVAKGAVQIERAGQ